MALLPGTPSNYEHREYPKWVHPEGKPAVLVQDEHEEAEVMGTEAPPEDPAPRRSRRAPAE